MKFTDRQKSLHAARVYLMQSRATKHRGWFAQVFRFLRALMLSSSHKPGCMAAMPASQSCSVRRVLLTCAAHSSCVQPATARSALSASGEKGPSGGRLRFGWLVIAVLAIIAVVARKEPIRDNFLKNFVGGGPVNRLPAWGGAVVEAAIAMTPGRTKNFSLWSPNIKGDETIFLGVVNRQLVEFRQFLKCCQVTHDFPFAPVPEARWINLIHDCIIARIPCYATTVRRKVCARRECLPVQRGLL